VVMLVVGYAAQLRIMTDKNGYIATRNSTSTVLQFTKVTLTVH